MAQVFFLRDSSHIQSQFIEKVGNSIRNHLINLKRHKSLDQNRNSFLETGFSQNSSQNDIDQNSYSNSKKKQRVSKNSRLIMTTKTSLPEQKKQILQHFKSSLKSKLHRRKQLQQIQNFNAHQKIRHMRLLMQNSKQQKKSIYVNRKRKQTQLMKSILQRSKGQMNMRKRQRQLQLSFSKWQRAEQKFNKLRSIKTNNQ